MLDAWDPLWSMVFANHMANQNMNDEHPSIGQGPHNTLKKRIAPGIWEDMNGNIHWSIEELLRMVDLPNTRENREQVTEMLLEIVRKEAPQATIVMREKPTD